MDEAYALLELGLLMLLGGFERALEVVQHGQELAHESLGRPNRARRFVARGPLAVVVELGLQPLERVEVLVALARHLGKLNLWRPSLLGRLSHFLLCHYDVFASSSMTS